MADAVTSSFQLQELPLDVLLKIFELPVLHPLDLLRLSRTTKSLRAILMRRSTESIWRKALSNTKGIPNCPKFLSEPAFTNMLFDDHCSQCLAPGSSAFSWQLLSRYCRGCAEAAFSPRMNINRKFGQNVIKILPQIVLFYLDGTRSKVLYHKETIRLWSKEFDQLRDNKARQDWLLEKASAFEEHDAQITGWRSWTRTRIKKQWRQDVKCAQAEIMRRAALIGWEAPAWDRRPRIYDRYITDEVWEMRKPTYLQELATARKRWLNFCAERAKDCKKYILQIQEDYRRSSCVNTIIPPPADFYRFPPFIAAIDQSPHHKINALDYFREAITQLPGLITGWVDQTDKNLLKMMQDSLGNNTQLNVSNLALATSLFECTRCGKEALDPRPCDALISYPRVLVHRGAIIESNPEYIYSTDDLPSLEDWTETSHYNAHQTIKFSKDIYDQVTTVVQMCHLDPLTTTAQQMDELDPIFCHTKDPAGQRECMTWRRTVSYLKDHPYENIQLVEGEMCIEAKTLLDKQKKTQWTNNRDHICVHCRERGNLVNIRDHLRVQHNLPYPTSEDFAVALDADIILHPVIVKTH